MLSASRCFRFTPGLNSGRAPKSHLGQKEKSPQAKWTFSARLDVGRTNDATPLLGLVRDQLAELNR